MAIVNGAVRRPNVRQSGGESIKFKDDAVVENRVKHHILGTKAEKKIRLQRAAKQKQKDQIARAVERLRQHSANGRQNSSDW
ncbi:MAG: hypothetical protein Q8P23_01520 [bacterium]|nr:hypothetical protein [bacterium]